MKIFQVGFHKQSEILSCHFGAEKYINIQPKKWYQPKQRSCSKISLYIYIYMYMCMCVCVYTVCAELLQS